MRTIFVCSPLRPGANSVRSVADNIALAERLCRAVLQAGHAPFAPHAFYTRFLDDADEAQRKLGMEAGRAFLLKCDGVWVYTGLGVSAGMCLEIDLAAREKIPVFFDPEPWATISPGRPGAR